MSLTDRYSGYEVVIEEYKDRINALRADKLHLLTINGEIGLDLVTVRADLAAAHDLLREMLTSPRKWTDWHPRIAALLATKPSGG